MSSIELQQAGRQPHQADADPFHMPSPKRLYWPSMDEPGKTCHAYASIIPIYMIEMVVSLPGWGGGETDAWRSSKETEEGSSVDNNLGRTSG